MGFLLYSLLSVDSDDIRQIFWVYTVWWFLTPVYGQSSIIIWDLYLGISCLIMLYFNLCHAVGEYSGKARSIPWLVMPRILVFPGHQQSFYWISKWGYPWLSQVNLNCFSFVRILILKIVWSWNWPSYPDNSNSYTDKPVSLNGDGPPGACFNIKAFKVWYSHYKDKTIMRLSYLFNGNSYTGKVVSLYWDSPPPPPLNLQFWWRHLCKILKFLTAP